MHFHIVTLFPKAFDSYLGESIIRRALEGGKIKASLYNPRDYVLNRWSRVDRPPYGGGPGLVIEALPVIRAIEAALKKTKGQRTKIIWLSPGGKQFDNSYASKVAKGYKHTIVICGRYEGIDARAKKAFRAEEVSVGPYVLTGGELPAMVIIDAVSRQIHGVLGNLESLEERRTASGEVYTRPEEFSHKGKRYRVPKVLLSGHHGRIEEWKALRQVKTRKQKKS